MIRLIKLFLKGLGFDVCAHEYSAWKDEYETGLRTTHYGLFKNTYREEREYVRLTHIRQTRRCYTCSNLQVRHIDLKNQGINL